MSTARNLDGSPFPVSAIQCIGRNYDAHAREMGATQREEPFHFVKSPTSLLDASSPAVLPYPPATADLHHELEIVVAIGRTGRDIPVAHALDHVHGYALGLDMTRRDRQAEAKAAGRPWTTGKDFDGAAVCGAITTGIPQVPSGTLVLEVNGVLRQRGDTSELIWSIPELISKLSSLRTLHAGELIYTGTPAGVGAVGPGDELVGRFPGLAELRVRIGHRPPTPNSQPANRSPGP